MTESEAPRRQRRKEARPGELTAAALSLFVEKGFAATRLDEVAARAGVSKGTLYLYFDSKEALFKAVIQDSVLPVFEACERKLEILADDPERLLRELLLDWWTQVGATEVGGITKLIVAEAGNFPDLASYHHEEVAMRWMGILGRAIQLGVDQGVFRPLDIPTLSQLVFFPMLMLAIWKNSLAGCVTSCSLPGGQPEAYFNTYFEMIFRGLRVAPGE
jgi:AcrR family transcriptional regulator